MTNSIFLTIKKLLGVAEEYHAFDIDILTAINATFLTLNQLGIGPRLPFQLPLMVDLSTDDEEESWRDDPAVTITWDDFLEDQKDYLAAVQTYVYQRVRLIFDPPTNSFLVDAIKKSCEEFEWRFTVQPKTEGAVEDVEERKVIYKGDINEDEDGWDDFPPVDTDPDNPNNPENPDDSDDSGEEEKPPDPNNPDDLYEIFG